MFDVADQQLIAGAAATLSWQPTDSDGEPATPGTVTVGVTRSDGTVVIVSGTVPAGTGASPRTVALTAAQTAQLDHLTATWTSGGVVVAVTVAEVIGRPLLTFAELVDLEPRAASIALPTFLRRRREVDRLFAERTLRGFTPRFEVQRLRPGHHDRGGVIDRPLVLNHPDLRRVRWARHVDTDGSVTNLTVSSVPSSPAGVAYLRDGTSWPTSGDVEIGYEYGYDRTPHDVLSAAALYLRFVAGSGTTSVPERATSYADGAGGVTQLATPGLGPFITGIPEVDEVLTAYRWNATGIA